MWERFGDRYGDGRDQQKSSITNLVCLDLRRDQRQIMYVAPTTGGKRGKVVECQCVSSRRLIASVDWFCFEPKWRSFNGVHALAKGVSGHACMYDSGKRL